MDPRKIRFGARSCAAWGWRNTDPLYAIVNCSTSAAMRSCRVSLSAPLPFRNVIPDSRLSWEINASRQQDRLRKLSGAYVAVHRSRQGLLRSYQVYSLRDSTENRKRKIHSANRLRSCSPESVQPQHQTLWNAFLW